MKSLLAFTLSAAPVFAQGSPAATESLKVNGKSVTVKYAAPSVRGRKIFGDGGLLSNDPTYPVWRAGANSATAFHTDADLNIAGLNVPKGDYTLYAHVKNPDAWELVVNKQTGPWGLEYDAAQDLGRVKMTMSKPLGRIARELCRWYLCPAATSARFNPAQAPCVAWE